jgi:hypothetical protein
MITAVCPKFKPDIFKIYVESVADASTFSVRRISGVLTPPPKTFRWDTFNFNFHGNQAEC